MCQASPFGRYGPQHNKENIFFFLAAMTNIAETESTCRGGQIKTFLRKHILLTAIWQIAMKLGKEVEERRNFITET